MHKELLHGPGQPKAAIFFYLEIGSSAHEQCVNRCPVSPVVHLPG